MIGNILAKTGEARFQEAPPQVLRFIGEGRVRNKEIPGKLFEGPSVSFSELVLCERNRLEVTRFGGAITAVRQSGPEGSLIDSGFAPFPIKALLVAFAPFT